MGKCISKHPSTLTLGNSQKDLSVANQICSKFSDSVECLTLKHETANQLCDNNHDDDDDDSNNNKDDNDDDDQDDGKTVKVLLHNKTNKYLRIATTIATTTTTTTVSNNCNKQQLNGKKHEETVADEEEKSTNEHNLQVQKKNKKHNNNIEHLKHVIDIQSSSNNNCIHECCWSSKNIANNCQTDVQHCNYYLQQLQQKAQPQNEEDEYERNHDVAEETSIVSCNATIYTVNGSYKFVNVIDSKNNKQHNNNNNNDNNNNYDNYISCHSQQINDKSIANKIKQSQKITRNKQLQQQKQLKKKLKLKTDNKQTAVYVYKSLIVHKLGKQQQQQQQQNSIKIIEVSCKNIIFPIFNFYRRAHKKITIQSV